MSIQNLCDQEVYDIRNVPLCIIYAFSALLDMLIKCSDILQNGLNTFF